MVNFENKQSEHSDGVWYVSALMSVKCHFTHCYFSFLACSETVKRKRFGAIFKSTYQLPMDNRRIIIVKRRNLCHHMVAMLTQVLILLLFMPWAPIVDIHSIENHIVNSKTRKKREDMKETSTIREKKKQYRYTYECKARECFVWSGVGK